MQHLRKVCTIIFCVGRTTIDFAHAWPQCMWVNSFHTHTHTFPSDIASKDYVLFLQTDLAHAYKNRIILVTGTIPFSEFAPQGYFADILMSRPRVGFILATDSISLSRACFDFGHACLDFGHAASSSYLGHDFGVHRTRSWPRNIFCSAKLYFGHALAMHAYG